MRQTPHPPGPQQIIWGRTSREEIFGNKRRCPHPEAMGDLYWCHYLRQTGGIIWKDPKEGANENAPVLLGEREVRQARWVLSQETGKPSVCCLCQRHARERSPSFTRKFVSSHGSKNGGTRSAHAWMGWRSDCNHGYEVVLLYDTRSLSLKFLAVQETGLRDGFGPRIGAINCVPK